MTTQIRIQHLDSVNTVEILVVDKANPPSPDTKDTIRQNVTLAAKGDEFAVFVHSDTYILVREGVQ